MQNEMLMDVPHPLSVLSSSYIHVVSHLAVSFSRFHGFPHTIASFVLKTYKSSPQYQISGGSSTAASAYRLNCDFIRTPYIQNQDLVWDLQGFFL